MAEGVVDIESVSRIQEDMIFIWVRLFNLYDWFRNLFKYYLWHPKFALVDSLLLLRYFFKSPYRIARTLYPESGPYGETPFHVMDTILTHITGSKVLEIGCGRGRLAFWLQMVRGFHVTGIDINELFIERARVVASKFNVPIVFGTSLKPSDLAAADLIYMFILHLSDDELKNLAHSFMKTRAVIVTISFWFGELVPEAFQLLGTCEVHFPWGKATAYFSCANAPSS